MIKTKSIFVALKPEFAKRFEAVKQHFIEKEKRNDITNAYVIKKLIIEYEQLYKITSKD